MKNKALEDLISILTRQAGLNVDNNIVPEELTNLQKRKSELDNLISSHINSMEKNEYILKIDKEKDLNEKKYLDELIKSLHEERTKYEKELDSIVSTEKNLKNNKKELDALKVNVKKAELNYELFNSKENYEELNKLKAELKAKTNKNIRMQVIDEELCKLNYEITKAEKKLKVVNETIKNAQYKDELSSISDEMTLKIYSEEVDEIDKALDKWENNPLVLGEKILDAFKSAKPIKDVKNEINLLVDKAVENLNDTEVEVKGSNIFEVMDRYEKLLNKSKENIISKTYQNEDELDKNLMKQQYHKNKIDKFKNSLEAIKERKTEVLNLITSSKDLADEIKIDRINKEQKIIDIEARLYEVGTTLYDGSVKELYKLIEEIRNEIKDEEYLENEYIDDIYALKEEQKNLDINYNTIECEIEKEKKVIDILNRRINENEKYIDKYAKLDDIVLSIEYNQRLNSLKNQQQYIYVDSAVIKSEIYNLWNSGFDVVESKTEETIEEKIEEIDEESLVSENIEAVLEEVESTNKKEEPKKDELINDDLEILDDFEF